MYERGVGHTYETAPHQNFKNQQYKQCFKILDKILKRNKASLDDTGALNLLLDVSVADFQVFCGLFVSPVT